MPETSPWSRPAVQHTRVRFGRMAGLAGGALGLALAAYPAWVRGSADGSGLFPAIWALECGVAAGFVAIGITVSAGRFVAAERRLFRAAIGSFGASYVLLALVGFGWTGDWLRFAAFRAGLRTERLVAGTGPAEWRVYAWRRWEFAGLANAAYLVFDPAERLAALPGSGLLPGVACQIVEDRAMMRPWHLVTTANCVLRRSRGVGPMLDI